LLTVATRKLSCDKALGNAEWVFAGGKDEENWKAQLESALQKADVFFSEIRASGLLQTTTKLKWLSQIQAEESVQISSGAFKYTKKAIEPKGKIAEKIYCRNPDKYVFRLERPEGMKSFTIKEILPKESAYSELYDIMPRRFLCVSHSVLGVPLSKITVERSFSVRSISIKKDVAKLDFSWLPTAELMPGLEFKSAEVWFSIEKGWAVEKYRVSIAPRGGKPTLIDGTVEYERMEDGIAIPKGVVEVHGTSGTVKFQFDKIEHYRSDPQDYTLSYYGFSEPANSSSPVHAIFNWWLWLLGAGLACVVIATYLFRRLQRIKRATPR
jgi:hypothetical protein